MVDHIKERVVDAVKHENQGKVQRLKLSRLAVDKMSCGRMLVGC